MCGIHITRRFISENQKRRGKLRKAQICGRWCKYQRNGYPLQILGLVNPYPTNVENRVSS
jgi:hypothetical protein